MKSKILVDKNRRIGKVEKEVFSSFIENMGRAVYGGIYDKNHPTADKLGFRNDVKEYVKELGVPLIRYPGGNYLSGFDWKDSIGPVEERKPKLDLAWRQLDPNKVGIDEFIEWCKDTNTQVMMSANLGTGTPKEAAELVEYCNIKGGSKWSDERIKNGHKDPYNIKVWCCGNEMDGPWQICAQTSEEYGRKVNETAKMMHWVDPSIKLVACGSSATTQPTFPEWDRRVLELSYENVDFISLHMYYTYNQNHDVKEFLASPLDFQHFIKIIKATADYVKAVKRSDKTINISVDEWNVWHRGQGDDIYADEWPIGPHRVENHYDVLDALVVSGLLCTLVNNCDRVKMACLAQLVNVIAPIMTEDNGRIFRQTIFYPYKYFIKNASEKTVIHTSVMVDTYKSTYGDAPYLYSAVCYDEKADEYTTFLVNTSDEEMEVNLDFCGENFGCNELVTYTNDDVNAKNSFDEPDKIVPVTVKGSGTNIVTIPKYSFAMAKFQKNNN